MPLLASAHPGDTQGAARPDGRLPGRLLRLLGNPVFWLAFVFLGMAVPISRQVLRAREPALPVLGTLPAFKLVDQGGRPFGSDELRGSAWVAGFVFSRCPTICPTIMATMGRIQHRSRGLSSAFHLVSFSVDPTHDTPDVLAAFGRAHKVSPRMWSLLTGDFPAVKTTVQEGLKISMGDIPGGPDQDFASIFHGTHFVLVDPQLRIRGYYDSSAPDVVDRLLHDAAMLVNRGD